MCVYFEEDTTRCRDEEDFLPDALRVKVDNIYSHPKNIHCNMMTHICVLKCQLPILKVQNVLMSGFVIAEVFFLLLFFILEKSVGRNETLHVQLSSSLEDLVHCFDLFVSTHSETLL